jgi:ABC-type lipoprotein export system ATPase subunit/GNAT superfamily N-acetyltransferase
MQNIKYLASTTIKETFRSKKIAGMFDVKISNKSERMFSVDHEIDERPWFIGAIVGPSGSGKSTIAKTLFGKLNNFVEFPHDECVLDGFPKEYETTSICDILSKVGFSSPPSWLLPYRLLSTGQQFRTQLAHQLLCNQKIIFDEFTSVVDRNVAAACSNCVGKYVKNNKKQFVAVSCHYDILEWLQPDWIIDMATQSFQWGSVRRPSLEIKIKTASKTVWPMFENHHYLSGELHPSAKIYTAEWRDEIVAFCADLHFPHPKVNDIRRIHRLVTLPDFQGFGFGPILLNEVAKINGKNKKRTCITTGHPHLIKCLDKSILWAMTSKPNASRSRGTKSTTGEKGAFGRLTASFEYVGKYE